VTDVKSASGLPDRALLDLALGPAKVLERLSVPVIVTRTAPGEARPRIVFVNDAMVRLLGYSREELLGKDPGFWQTVDGHTADDTALRLGRTVARATVALCNDGCRKTLRVEMVPHLGSWGLWVVTTVLATSGASLEREGDRNPQDEPATLRVGDLRLNVSTRRVELGGRTAELTPSECVVLATLMQEPGCAVERAVLYKELWGSEPPIRSRAIDVYVGALRRKLRELGAPDMIHTIRGVGYLIHV
jgi:Transcriptional regulatory protein, C terminal/PAS domain